MNVNLSVEIAGIKMQNPVMPASGTLGYGEEYAGLVNISKLGAVVTKGVTVKPREGNPQPRIWETPAGMINNIGLENPGLDIVIKEKIPFLSQFGVPIIVNICGERMRDYIILAAKLNLVEEVSGLEVNISCPNVKKGGMSFGQDPKITGKLIGELRDITDLPLIVKLTPNVTDIVSVAKAAINAGADAISLINTVRARAKIRSGPHNGKWIIGGLSGPCVKPVALQKIAEIREAGLDIPIVGMGGITNLQDALEFFEAGVDAIAVGTATFVNPKTMEGIIHGLEKYMKDQKITSLDELREKIKRR